MTEVQNRTFWHAETNDYKQTPGDNPIKSIQKHRWHRVSMRIIKVAGTELSQEPVPVARFEAFYLSKLEDVMQLADKSVFLICYISSYLALQKATARKRTEEQLLLSLGVHIVSFKQAFAVQLYEDVP